MDHLNDSFHYMTIERWLEQQVAERLIYFRGCKTKVAASLGISRTKLYRKMSEFEVTRRYREMHQ